MSIEQRQRLIELERRVVTLEMTVADLRQSLAQKSLMPEIPETPSADSLARETLKVKRA